MPKTKAIEDMTLDELVALRDALAAERHELRLRQRAVEDAIVFKQAVEGLPPELVKRIHLEGKISAAGGTN